MMSILHFLFFFFFFAFFFLQILCHPKQEKNKRLSGISLVSVVNKQKHIEASRFSCTNQCIKSLSNAKSDDEMILMS